MFSGRHPYDLLDDVLSGRRPYDVLDDVLSGRRPYDVLDKVFQAAILMMSLKCFQAEATVSQQAGVAVVSSCAYTTAAFSFS